MTHHPLIRYIKEARREGFSSARIVEALTAAGWHVHDIVDIVLDHAEERTAPEHIISVENVSKSYGAVRALDNISLTVRRASVTALLGPNGAGKTTLIRILTTLLAPDRGRVTVAGLDVVRHASELRAMIGLAGQHAAVDEILTGRENLVMVGRLYHLPGTVARARAQELLKQFALEDAADRPVRTYSSGMRRRLDLAASLVVRPRILFLDEPTAGLDPSSRLALWRVIRDLVENGTTVLLTTQYLEEADQLAHHIFVVDHGRIIAQGSAEELKRAVGGAVLEIHLADQDDANRAAEVLERLGSEPPHADSATGIVTMPVSGDASVIAEAVRRLDQAELALRDIMLRHPSLDDVFMKLTGHEAE
ncbi:MAG: ATP-binding cassette domain-containing protein [bacterium]|nr:ATP-binding cassette domain-containing protein [bacterium]MDZ4296552.1 ATP-binding cassette domain-containing protein [Patescibacteria group bacterium]